MKQSLFQWREARAPLITVLVTTILLMALASRAEAVDLSGSAAITSDYVWRGSSQSKGDPAIQAGFKATWPSGLYASAWASTVKFDPLAGASSELDLNAGWAGALNDDWTLDLNVLHYRYPTTRINLNWTELNGTLKYRDRHWVSLGYSNEALGYAASGTYVLVGTTMPLGKTLRVEATLAHYFLDAGTVGRSGYSHAALNAIWAFKAPFELRLSAHATDARAEAIFGRPLAGNRFEAALQAAF